MNDIVAKILIKINKKPLDIAKKKHGKSPEITYGVLISAIIKFNSVKDSREYLGIAEQTFNRTMKRCFPNVVLRGGGQTWSHYLLTLVGYKRCFKCNQIKALSEIAAKQSVCKVCRHIYNTSDVRKQANKLSQQQHYKHNIGYHRNKSAKYKIALKNSLLSDKYKEKIQEVYKNCPAGHHVDHIVPIQGKYVCGLHVPWNLQYLLSSVNISKSNYHESEEYWK